MLPLTLEYKKIIEYPGLKASTFGLGEVLTYDSNRLTTALPRKGAEKGDDRAICRTVNGIARLNCLTVGNPGSEFVVLATASLMGVTAGKVAVIQTHTTGPTTFGVGVTSIITGPNPTSNYFGAPLYGAANMSAGAYGFDYFSSYSNLADEIFIRIQISTLILFGPVREFRIPVKFEMSTVLLAHDPA